jgi:ribosomal protein L29
MKKASSKAAPNQPRLFFSVLPIGPNLSQISIPVPLQSPTAELLYNDFDTNAQKISRNTDNPHATRNFKRMLEKLKTVLNNLTRK